MSTIRITSGALQALVTLKRDRLEPTNLQVDRSKCVAELDYTNDIFNALLAMGNANQNVRFNVDVLSVEEDVIAVLEAADWICDPAEYTYANPAWYLPTTYQLQVKTAGQIGFLVVTDQQIANMLGSTDATLLRMFCPTEDQIKKYHLTETTVPGVYKF